MKELASFGASIITKRIADEKVVALVHLMLGTLTMEYRPGLDQNVMMGTKLETTQLCGTVQAMRDFAKMLNEACDGAEEFETVVNGGLVGSTEKKPDEPSGLVLVDPIIKP